MREMPLVSFSWLGAGRTHADSRGAPRSSVCRRRNRRPGLQAPAAAAVDKCTNAQAHKRTSAQGHKRTGAQAHRGTNAQAAPAVGASLAMNHESRIPVVGMHSGCGHAFRLWACIPVVGMPSGWGGHAPGPGRALCVKCWRTVGKFLAAEGVLFVHASPACRARVELAWCCLA